MSRERKPNSKFHPTERDRALVSRMIGYGLTHKETASLIYNPRTDAPIDPSTLRRHFPEECATAKLVMKRRLIESLYKRALDPLNPRGDRAAMFILKCQHGWSETSHHTVDVQAVAGVLVAPAGVSPEAWVARQVQRDDPDDEDDEGEDNNA